MPKSARRIRKLCSVGREGRRHLEGREGDDIDDERRTAAIFLRHRAEEEGAERTHGQRPEDGFDDLLALDVKAGCDGGEAECEQEEVEGVERPAQETGEEGAALDRSERTDLLNKRHIAES